MDLYCPSKGQVFPLYNTTDVDTFLFPFQGDKSFSKKRKSVRTCWQNMFFKPIAILGSKLNFFYIIL